MRSILALLVFFVFHTSYAGTLVISSPSDVISARGIVSYLEDASDTLSMSSLIRSEPGAYPFRLIEGSDLNPGFTNSAFWLRFSLKNKDTLPKDLVFALTYPLINHLEIIELENGNTIRKVTTGDHHAFNTRGVHNRNYLFNIYLEPGVCRTYYLYLNNFGETLRIPFELCERQSYYQDDSVDLAIKSLYYGFLFFALIFNIFLFVTIRDKLYLFFSLYVFFLAMFFLNIDGLSFQLFWPQCPWWANRSTIVAVSMANIFLLIFSKTFLKIRTLAPFFNRLLNLIIVLVLFFLIGAFTRQSVYSHVVKTINFFSLLTTFIVLGISIYAINRSYRPALFFLFSFILLLLGVSSYVLRNTGTLPTNFITQHGVKFGFAVQVLFLSFAVSDRFRRIMEEARDRLESLVRERTREIAEQNREITSSIQYAQRIQSAVLPNPERLSGIPGDHFILYQPRDIVSGDFYWMWQKEEMVFVAVADCTGHGVPGAFMSMLGVAFLNEIVGRHTHQDDLTRLEAATVLKELTEHVIQTLSNSPYGDEVRDGMDISLCMIDTARSEMQYAGAHSPLYLIGEQGLQIIKGDKWSVGLNVKRDISFTNHRIAITRGTTCYLFTDGYIDQFGREASRSFSSRRFRRLLEEIQHEQMSRQKEILEEKLKEWRGNVEQIDDILVMGIRFDEPEKRE